MVNNKRLQVLELSIFVERFVSTALSSLLDIDLDTSKTLSNKSSALSFRQKLDLLTDIRATDKVAVTKFQIFSEIRNQFAHNYQVKDFTTCFSFLDGAENQLRKAFKGKIEGLEKQVHEDQLASLYAYLFKDVMDHAYRILEKITEKFLKLGKEQGEKEVLEMLIDRIKAHADEDESFSQTYSQIVEEVIAKFRDKNPGAFTQNEADPEN